MTLRGQCESIFFLLGFGTIMVMWLLQVPSTVMSAQTDFDDYRFDGGFCEYYQVVEPGNKSYYLYSPGYPEPYLADRLKDRECQWFAKTPSPVDRLVLDCHEFDLPEVPKLSLVKNSLYHKL